MLSKYLRIATILLPVAVIQSQTSAAEPGPHAKASRPNVIILIADDVSWKLAIA
ncbi:MAG: hypothetical protein AAF802_07145 [Planctomycetota bacterium]